VLTGTPRAVPAGGRGTGRLFVAVVVFAVAMAYVEAAVVVDLRSALGTGSDVLPLVRGQEADRLIAIEVGRELATLVMLAAVGWIAGAGPIERLAWAAVAFGTWDIGYYAWLRAMIDWPASLATLDVLFLVPVPWTGPVWAPIVVSVALVAFGLLAAARLRRGASLPLRRAEVVAGVSGGLLVVTSFMLEAGTVMAGGLPDFPWPWFVVGMALATAGAVRSLRRSPDTPGHEP
jgi:hypothetical protein